MAQLRQKLVVVLEIDAQQNRNAEDKLSMRDGIEDVVGDVLPGLNRFFWNDNSGSLADASLGENFTFRPSSYRFPLSRTGGHRK